MKIITAQECAQRSEAWNALHIGRPTASMFHEICTPAKLEYSKGDGSKTAMYRLAAERLLNLSFGRSLDGLQWIEMGKSQEPKAVQQYEMLEDARTFLVSFIMPDDERVGCSPDALVEGDNAHGIEIKSLFPPKMVRLHMEGMDVKHRVQVLGQMWIGEMEVNDYFAYNEDMPPFLKRWKRSEVAADIEKVRGHVLHFCDDLDKCVEQLNADGFFNKRAVPTTKLDEMALSMIGDIEQWITTVDTIGAIERWEADPAVAAELGKLPAEERQRLRDAARTKREFMALGV